MWVVKAFVKTVTTPVGEEVTPSVTESSPLSHGLKTNKSTTAVIIRRSITDKAIISGALLFFEQDYKAGHKQAAAGKLVAAVGK